MTNLSSPLDLSLSSVELTRIICDIESVSGNEKALADVIETALRAHPHLEVIRDGDAVVARTDLGRNDRVVIAGHIDTVPLNNNLPTRFETIDGEEYLWGRGTVDMKAGAAVHLKLAAELVDPKVDITWIWYDHEEVDASLNGLGRLARNNPELLQGTFAILGEPTRAEIEGGCNGHMRVELRTTGIRAHSARSWVGKNAIHGLAPVLSLLAEYQAAEVDVDGLVYREGLNAVGVHGGIAGNVIPDEAVLTVNYRFAPSKSAAQAEQYLRSLFAGVELVVTDAAEGARPGMNHPLTQEFARAVNAPVGPKYGWTDVARFSALGIPAVNYGPGDPLKAHADDEQVPLAQIAACEEGLRGWLSGSTS